jgi:hypothetical protein
VVAGKRKERRIDIGISQKDIDNGNRRRDGGSKTGQCRRQNWNLVISIQGVKNRTLQISA